MLKFLLALLILKEELAAAQSIYDSRSTSSTTYPSLIVQKPCQALPHMDFNHINDGKTLETDIDQNSKNLSKTSEDLVSDVKDTESAARLIGIAVETKAPPLRQKTGKKEKSAKGRRKRSDPTRCKGRADAKKSEDIPKFNTSSCSTKNDDGTYKVGLLKHTCVRPPLSKSPCMLEEISCERSKLACSTLHTEGELSRDALTPPESHQRPETRGRPRKKKEPSKIDSNQPTSVQSDTNGSMSSQRLSQEQLMRKMLPMSQAPLHPYMPFMPDALSHYFQHVLAQQIVQGNPLSQQFPFPAMQAQQMAFNARFDPMKVLTSSIAPFSSTSFENQSSENPGEVDYDAQPIKTDSREIASTPSTTDIASKLVAGDISSPANVGDPQGSRLNDCGRQTQEKSSSSKSPSSQASATRATSPASTSESHVSARDLDSDITRGRTRKRLLKHPKSKHRNVVDPVFVAQVENLSDDISGIRLGTTSQQPPTNATSPIFSPTRFMSPDSATPGLPQRTPPVACENLVRRNGQEHSEACKAETPPGMHCCIFYFCMNIRLVQSLFVLQGTVLRRLVL